jgi:hypothetical protein
MLDKVVPYGRLYPIEKKFMDEDLGRKYWDWLQLQVKPWSQEA